MSGFYGRSKSKSLIRFAKHSIPPFHSLFDGENLTGLERLKVISIKYYLNLVRSTEEVKIAFGKKANRS
jgi:hypothetical protein